VTRLIPATWFVMRDEILRRTSGGKTNLKDRFSLVKETVRWWWKSFTDQSAVIKSSDWTALSAMTCKKRGEGIRETQISVKRKLTDLLVSAFVTHDADGLDREEDCKRLTDLVIETCFSDLFDKNIIGLLQDLDLFWRHWTQDPDRQSGPRKRVTLYEWCGNIK
jgi:hypothetical protein